MRDLRELSDRLAALSPPGPDEPDIGPSVALLRTEGWLAACAPTTSGGADLAHRPGDPARLVELLAATGAANLSLGRLFEGHVNAVKLLILHASGAARERWLGAVRDGALFGVWGAEGRAPVRLSRGRLSGQKLFASGADILDHAVVTARDEDGAVRLLVLDLARLRGRLHPEEWSVSGMKATASGRVDLDGLAVSPQDMLGRPGDYMQEPHFRGGVWRYAAVQMGAMRAMTRAAAGQIRARGQVGAPLQAARLRRMATACETARLWLCAAAERVEAPCARAEDAAPAMLARLTVEREAVALMQEMDAALGAASFATGHPVERHRRDLQLYLRQADPDGMGEAALESLASSDDTARTWHLA